MTWRLAVSLAVALVLAGCSGVSAPPDVGGTETGTLTPVPVPEQNGPVGATPGAGRPEALLAPGLTEDGVTDPFALADAHGTRLANRSFTRIIHTSLIGPNGTLRVRHQSLAVAEGGETYHLVATSESEPAYPVSSVAPRIEIWYASGPAQFRVGEGENVSYRVGMTGTLDGPVDDISGEDRLVGLYGTVDRWTVEPTLGWNGTLLILESQEPPDEDVLRLPALVEDPQDARLRVVMTADGRVVSHRLTYDATFEGKPVRVIRRVRFVKVGNTTVDEPEWHEEARSETIDERRGDG